MKLTCLAFMFRCLAILFLFYSFKVSSQENFNYRFSDPSPFEDGVRLNWVIEIGSTCQGMRVFHGTSVDSLVLDTIYGGICGNANFEQGYSYLHKEAVVNDTNYYQILFGRDVYSEIKSVFYLKLAEDELRIGPNPSSGLLNIFQGANNEPSVMRIWNYQGQLIEELVVQGNSLQVLDVSRHPSGQYLYRIERESILLKSGKILLR